MSTKKSLLRQFSPNELRSLMSKKKLKVPSNWGKRELVPFCDVNFSKKEIESVVKPITRGTTSKERGFEAQLKGTWLEDKVMKIFQRQGYTCTKNTRTKRGVRAEFDVVGYKDEKSFLSTNRIWIFVECKNKSKVIPSDWKKFLGNFNTFKKRKKVGEENVQGYLYTTGLFAADVKKEARLYQNIKLKRIKK